MKAHAWKACIPQGIVGSNPTLSVLLRQGFAERCYRLMKEAYMFKPKLKPINKSKPSELQAWMWSWGIGGLGLGAYYANYLQRYVFFILLIGVAVHIWSMYRVYLKK